MSTLSSWEKILELKAREQVIRLELNRIDRFIANPFANKTKSSAERKKLYEKAIQKRKDLREEYKSNSKEMAELIKENKKKAAERRKK